MSDFLKYKGVIVPKPRMTRSDTWKKRPIVLNYFAFKDAIVKQARDQSFILGEAYAVLFNIPMPKSWSEKKKNEMSCKPHKGRPDLDNLIKAVQDSLLEEDGIVWKVDAIKLWNESGSIYIVNTDKEEFESIMNDASEI